MKKLLSYVLTILFFSSLSSCFLFKPVQKTCPAYSLNSDDNNQNTIIISQSKDFKDYKSLD